MLFFFFFNFKEEDSDMEEYDLLFDDFFDFMTGEQIDLLMKQFQISLTNAPLPKVIFVFFCLNRSYISNFYN